MSAAASTPAGRAEGRRQQLLAAARAVLAEHGYERTTVSSIASRANVAQGTFYLYFPSKEALPGALAEELCVAVGAAIAEDTAGASSLDEAVGAMVAATYRAGDTFADVLLICNRGIELAKDLDEWLRITIAWRTAIEDVLRRFQQAGEVAADLNLETTAYVLRDLLDRGLKARIALGHQEYADVIAGLTHRAVSA